VSEKVKGSGLLLAFEVGALCFTTHVGGGFALGTQEVAILREIWKICSLSPFDFDGASIDRFLLCLGVPTTLWHF